ncbi:uncharacterized protein LOC142175955 [Nicotiana tabacum]|uniref:Uncharacterized protein LOC142175955 n=1 Tax=Nicotiana tabacum TaxID=4097 RepID=A0AC58TPB2_TOBAC
MNKLDEHGYTTRARLVVQGYNQEEGIDCDETFAPVARMKAIRILITFASYMEFTLFQMDVKTNSLCEEFAKLMGSEFEMNMMSELNFFLGFQVKQSTKGTFICKKKYIKELLKRFDMEASKAIDTPIVTATDWTWMSLDLLLSCGQDKYFWNGSLSWIIALNMAKNLVQHKRTKHIDVRHHFLRVNVEKMLICMKFYSTEEQIADIFTKALSREHFERNRVKLGLLKPN